MKPSEYEVKKFTIEIEQLMIREELNYIEAIVRFCEIKDIDVSDIIPHIKLNKNLKNNIYKIASKLNLVKKHTKLKL